MTKNTLLFTLALCISATTAFAAGPAASAASAAKPAIAKQCALCHKAEPGAVRGNFDIVTFKAKTIQVKIDDAVELLKFDEDDIKVVDGAGKTGDGEFLKDNLVKRGHEIKVEFSEKDGVKTAVKLIVKPPVKISDDMLLKTADIEKLVAKGPEKGKYFLYDSRPLLRFQEGAIPTAINLPFPSFDKMAEKLLPNDKNALIIFYCSGPTCSMSPGSAAKAGKLGYTNIKVYRDGMPGWQEKNYGVISSLFLKEAWIDKNIPHVLFDARSLRGAAKGFIKGAVSFPAKQAAKLVKGVDVKKNAPIIVYDQKGGKDSETVTKELIKAGFNRVSLLSGGFEAWQSAKYDVATGKLTSKATYTPKLRPGEINLDEFKKYAAELPSSVMIIDARSTKEGNAGMLKGAKLIPVDEIKDRLAEIPREKLIVFYCNTGVLAEIGYNTLKELGYTNVKFVNARIKFEKNGTYEISPG
ncbi:MAG: rhodanese-like domain-containing protein [Desulfuromonadaceae bacterium]|nr:rhodanese-like domain-containing protein [Desulfuromonadaceae bacterium]